MGIRRTAVEDAHAAPGELAAVADPHHGRGGAPYRHAAVGEGERCTEGRLECVFRVVGEIPKTK